MDPFKLMKQDHKKAQELFDRICETTNRAEKTREDLFEELKNELNAHAHMEEEVFYPSVKNVPETHEITLESYEEHHVMKILLNELDKMPKDSDEWLAKFKVLKENVEHHVKEEEHVMFPKSKHALRNDDLEEIGLKMLDAKHHYMKEKMRAKM